MNTYRYDPAQKHTKRVGGWVLEWHPSRPGVVWAIPEHLKQYRRTESAVRWPNGVMAWDYGNVPAYVTGKVSAFLTECQQQHNTTTERG